ncbi:hypothetical protein [Microbispora sp. CA-102843]|uniref:hypothetical protein n=1 Tax=Microbispora sp. CA-102843 TaxID=3239952 RepID=UPI003D8AD6EC
MAIIGAVTGAATVTPALAAPAPAPVWSYADLPPHKGYDRIDLVAAAGARDIWAVGTQDRYVRGVKRTYSGKDGTQTLAHFDGMTWHRAALPPHGRIRSLSAAPSSVWALTSAHDGDEHDGNEVVRWDGRRWRSVPPPAPGANEIAATSGGGAWLATWTRNESRLLRHDGKAWHTIPSPKGLAVTDILVRGGRDVWVGGWLRSGRPGAQTEAPALLHWDGRSLRRITIPAKVFPRGIAYGASQVKDIVVAGQGDVWVTCYDLDGGPDDAIALRRRGKTWRRVTPPARTASLHGVVDDGAGGVWFDYGLAEPMWHLHSGRINKGRWSKTEALRPPSGRGFGGYGAGEDIAHIPGTTLLIRAGASSVPDVGKDAATTTASYNSTDGLIVAGPEAS